MVYRKSKEQPFPCVSPFTRDHKIAYNRRIILGDRRWYSAAFYDL